MIVLNIIVANQHHHQVSVSCPGTAVQARARPSTQMTIMNRQPSANIAGNARDACLPA